MEILIKQNITHEDMDNLLVCAFEGGINYWCGKIEITKPAQEDTEHPDAKWASHTISRGGQLALWDVEDPNEVWWLTRDKMLKGITEGMKHFSFATVEDLMDGHDAEVADVIVQYALFDEIVFG
jgi:hypothetical protein